MHRPRWFLLAALLAFVVAVPPAQAEAPMLKPHEAEFYMSKALKREFGATYTHGYSTLVNCTHRKGRSKMKCQKIAWFIGDLEFYGQGRIWYSVDRQGRLIWNYAFKIKQYNAYCLDTGGSNCVETIRVR